MPTNTQFPRPSSSSDPYRDYRFRVKWKGRYVAGVSKVSGMTHPTQVIVHRSSGDPSTPRRMPGQSEYGAITLERGVTHDVEFVQWAYKVWDDHNSAIDDDQVSAGSQDVSFKDLREDITLEVYNEAGQKVISYTIHRCWPSEFTALPEIDPNGNAVAIQMLKLENEGWERDTLAQETVVVDI